MMRHISSRRICRRTAIVALALMVVSCQGAVVTPVNPGKRPVAQSGTPVRGLPAVSETRSPSVSETRVGEAALFGQLLAPIGLVSNNGGSVIGNNGGSFRLFSLAQAPVANTMVMLQDAFGEPVLDERGQPLQTVTDAQGRFRIETAVPGKNLILSAVLPNQAGRLQAVSAKDMRSEAVTLDLISTLTTGYILERYVASQADRQGVLDRLPGGLERETREQAKTAFTNTRARVPDTLDAGTILRAVDALRLADGSFDRQMEDVRRVLILAGQSDLGNGELASRVRLGELNASALRSDGTQYLMDNRTGRLWHLAGNLLYNVAGSGGGTATIPAPPVGSRAVDVNLGSIIAITLDAADRPVLLAENRLDYVGADGLIRRLWETPTDVIPVAVLRSHTVGFLVVTRKGFVGVAGAVAPVSPLTTESSEAITDAEINREGTIYLLTDDHRMWRIRDGQVPERVDVPAELQSNADCDGENCVRWLGLDDAGALMTSDPNGNVAFYDPDRQTIERISAAVTNGWPEAFSLKRVRSEWSIPDDPDFSEPTIMHTDPFLKINGDTLRGRYLVSPRSLGKLNADGSCTLLAGEMRLSSAGTTVETPSALNSPTAALFTGDGQLLVSDRGSGQILGVTNRVATLVAGVPWSDSYML